MLKVVGNKLFFAGKEYRCAIGKNGFSADKKEGDGRTPIGVFAFRECWYRADKMPPPATKLSLKIIHKNDGWCDDTLSQDYNKHIKLPEACHPARGVTATDRCLSHEKLWREDDIYDLIIPIGYNDAPIVKGAGSAIFMHIARENYEGTEGCVALSKADLLEILPMISADNFIEIDA